MSENVLSVNDITMQFGGVVAVNNLSMHIDKGEIVALIGPNGAGKTTAFNVITGVYAPTNGSISFHGKEIIENFPQGKMKKIYNGQNEGKYNKSIVKTPDKITKMGIARTFQNIRLFKSLSVLDNVIIATHLNVKSNLFADTVRWPSAAKEEKENREKALKLLERTGLLEHKDDIASSLPYGLQRRLEIARALATEPTLLLLDEPAAGMNPIETEELTQFIYEIRDEFNLSILLIEHHMQLVMDISDRIYVLEYGRLIANGVPEEIQSNPAVIKAYLGEEE